MYIRELIFFVNFNLLIIILMIKLTYSMDFEQDNQLVSLDDDENNLNQVNNEFERIDKICKVPKFAPYLTVLRVSRTEIEFNVTDINDKTEVDGFLIYYWGFRLGPKSSYKSEDRHFGHKNFTKDGPFVLTNLQPKFSYCADFCSHNSCGHSPFCISCFEQILTL